MLKEEEIQQNFLRNEQTLSKYATKTVDAIRLKEEPFDVRPAFFHDTDRIIHSLSYTRYAHKTQVYSYQENDHISKRMIHVQLVSKIARTIGRALCLNEDLIEAIALGHDIGHTPLGHAGEAILDEISKRELNESFAHNIQSVRNYMEVENDGRGLNLSVQVLDGILCHNGEILSSKYEPVSKTKEQFLEEYQKSYQDLEQSKSYHPMTLEGCVVRISDLIAYIGRDIEDAITLQLFDRNSIPEEITQVLGNNNRDIINHIILDVITESLDQPYIKLSNPVFEALNKLKTFNYQNIYEKSATKEDMYLYKEGMELLFETYLEDIQKKHKDSIIYTCFLNNMIESYQTIDPKRQVLDFLSGMTDEFFLTQLRKTKGNL